MVKAGSTASSTSVYSSSSHNCGSLCMRGFIWHANILQLVFHNLIIPGKRFSIRFTSRPHRPQVFIVPQATTAARSA
ncbi:hypothetical protein J6590_088152 [Homalodisca vitripennis]|nr:hypothetical protein J6590_088152 [Homalodisca vitripennis]